MQRFFSNGALALSLLLAFATVAPTRADEAPHRYHRHRYSYDWSALPPEHHVIEQVRNGISTDFVLNGAAFTGVDACALGWTAGDRIKLVHGDWHGDCDIAVFYNASRHRTCELACR